jgi:hypothetical protein
MCQRGGCALGEEFERDFLVLMCVGSLKESEVVFGSGEEGKSYR